VNTRIQYQFREPNRLKEALTHSSYANEHREKGLVCNERLEFLGDSVLSIVISDYIYRRFLDLDEGDLTKIRASIVCEDSLAIAAKRIDLGSVLYLGKGEERTGGRKRKSILADAFEAVIGAIYLDGGIEEARKFIRETLASIIEDGIQGRLNRDYKTEFQEYAQRNGEVSIRYEIVDQTGPDHCKEFEAAVFVDNNLCGQGVGSSKKEAEQEAAQDALEKVT